MHGIHRARVLTRNDLARRRERDGLRVRERASESEHDRLCNRIKNDVFSNLIMVNDKKTEL